jgi:hypothetical protein
MEIPLLSGWAYFGAASAMFKGINRFIGNAFGWGLTKTVRSRAIIGISA